MRRGWEKDCPHRRLDGCQARDSFSAVGLGSTANMDVDGRRWERRGQCEGGDRAAPVCSGVQWSTSTPQTSGGMGQGAWFPRWRQRLNLLSRGDFTGGDGCLWHTRGEQAAEQSQPRRAKQGEETGWLASKQRRHQAVESGNHIGVATYSATRSCDSSNPSRSQRGWPKAKMGAGHGGTGAQSA